MAMRVAMSPPNASRGRRRAAWPTWSTRWRARSDTSAATRRDPVDVFLPRYRGVPGARSGASSGDGPARAGPAVADRDQRGHDRRRRRPTAIGCASSTIRRRSIARASTATRRATTPTTRGGSGCSAGPRSEALRADGRPVDVLHLHDWHTGPAAIFRDARYADDPIVGGAAILMTLHNLAYHGWTPRRALGQLGLRRATGSSRPTPTGIDLLARRDRAGRARQHGLARRSRPRR